ncbi:MAG: hypothetical protein JWN18_650 [Parcubacteria group bacterium]|nr:hypothetical protein [Parcubacteria group bacterium]
MCDRFPAARPKENLDNLWQVANVSLAVTTPEPYQAAIDLPVPFPIALEDIPLSSPCNLTYFSLVQVKRWIVLVLRTVLSRELVCKNSLYLYEMESLPFLSDKIELPCFASDIAVANLKVMSHEILSGYLLA